MTPTIYCTFYREYRSLLQYHTLPVATALLQIEHALNSPKAFPGKTRPNLCNLCLGQVLLVQQDF